jgi:hypothetical protein
LKSWYLPVIEAEDSKTHERLNKITRIYSNLTNVLSFTVFYLNIRQLYNSSIEFSANLSLAKFKRLVSNNYTQIILNLWKKKIKYYTKYS